MPNKSICNQIARKFWQTTRIFQHQIKQKLTQYVPSQTSSRIFGQTAAVSIAKKQLEQAQNKTAWGKNFSSRNKTASAHHACLTKQSEWLRIFAQAQNSNVLFWIFVSTLNRQSTPSMPNKTIPLIQHTVISNIQQPRAGIFNHECKQCVWKNYLSSNCTTTFGNAWNSKSL